MPTVSPVAEALVASSVQDKYGLRPYDPQMHAPTDIGLGGPSTEFLATDFDQSGAAFNYPSIWWDKSGHPHLLDPDTAYEQALTYEALTGRTFPRYGTLGGAEMAAMSRSSLGGGQRGPLASLFGLLP